MRFRIGTDWATNNERGRICFFYALVGFMSHHHHHRFCRQSWSRIVDDTLEVTLPGHECGNGQLKAVSVTLVSIVRSIGRKTVYEEVNHSRAEIYWIFVYMCLLDLLDFRYVKIGNMKSKNFKIRDRFKLITSYTSLKSLLHWVAFSKWWRNSGKLFQGYPTWSVVEI